MKVEIWSDIVCPWCAVGKARFERALSSFAHRDDVEVTYRSFELDPSAPRERGDINRYLAEKYGTSIDRAREMHAHMAEVAAEEGLDFRFDQARAGNTFDAHRLLHLAAGHGLQLALKDRLLRAYFAEGEPIADRDALVRLAAEVGLDADEVRAALASDRYADAVRADEREAQQLGISGVPFFVIDRRLGISGAQPAEMLRSALEQAWEDANPLTVLSGADGAEACVDDVCVS